MSAKDSVQPDGPPNTFFGLRGVRCLNILTIFGRHKWKVPEEVLAVELESLVDDGEEEASDHGADEAPDAVDLPEGEEDGLGVAAVEVHRHAHVHAVGRDHVAVAVVSHLK